MERVTTKEAAKLLNMDVVTLQFLMRQERLPISSIKHNCIRDFINGNKRKEFIFIWYECHLFINKLWSNRFDSESTFCKNSLDMGSSFSCVGTFICNADKKIA